ncbi:MAG: hypothetical protein Q4A33_01535 [Candidatus Saccharibacteria bacterium]|nr:hypothetical protein [Candidatus Saccharibacteria bacterium]
MKKAKLFILSDQYDDGVSLGIGALKQAMECLKKNLEAWKDEIGDDFECKYVPGEDNACIHDKIYDNFLEIHVRDVLDAKDFFKQRFDMVCSGPMDPFKYELHAQINGLEDAFGFKDGDFDEHDDAIIIDYSCMFQVEARIMLDYLAANSIEDSWPTEVISPRIIDDPQLLPEAILRLLISYKVTEAELADAYKYGDGDSVTFNSLSNKFAKSDDAMASFWSYVFKIVAIELA